MVAQDVSEYRGDARLSAARAGRATGAFFPLFSLFSTALLASLFRSAQRSSRVVLQHRRKYHPSPLLSLSLSLSTSTLPTFEFASSFVVVVACAFRLEIRYTFSFVFFFFFVVCGERRSCVHAFWFMFGFVFFCFLFRFY